MAEFSIEIVDRDSIRCAGMKVRTNMAKASTDCPALWQKDFGPRMEAFPADPAHADQSYGVSVMLDSDNFDYWAVMPIVAGADVPEGMDVITIPGGKYARCALASLKDLGDAYNFIYGPWIAGQEKYALNMQGAALELYTHDYLKTGALTVLCPLLEK